MACILISAYTKDHLQYFLDTATLGWGEHMVNQCLPCRKVGVEYCHLLSVLVRKIVRDVYKKKGMRSIRLTSIRESIDLAHYCLQTSQLCWPNQLKRSSN